MQLAEPSYFDDKERSIHLLSLTVIQAFVVQRDRGSSIAPQNIFGIPLMR